MCVVRLTQNSIHCLRSADILQNGATVTRMRRRDELLNKVDIFIFFAQKKFSRCFIKFRLNHCWQMDYFDDVFHTFLGLESVIYYAVNGTVTSLPVFHPKCLKLCSEDELNFYGFGTTWG